MKNVKFFLTACTICLAIAAVAGTKANGKFATRGYTEDPITHKCTVDSGIDCAGGPNNCLNGGGFQLFAKDINNPCSTLLKMP